MALEQSSELERPEAVGEEIPSPDGLDRDPNGVDGMLGGDLLATLRDHVQTPLFRNAYALIINTGITAVLGFVYWVVAARFYSTRDVGLAAAAISAMTLLAGMSLFNLEAVMVRFMPIAGASARSLAGLVYLLSGVAATVLAALFIFGLDIWEPTLGFLKESGGGLWFVVATVAWMVFVLQDGILVGLGRAVWVPIENTIFGIGKLALLVAFVGAGPIGIFRSWTIAAAVVVIPFTLLIFHRFIPDHMQTPVASAEPLSRQMLRQYAIADYVGAMFDLAAISLLPLLVTHWAGPEENAYFYQSWIIAYTLILVANNTARALTVEAAKDQAQLQAYGRVVFAHTLKLLVPAVIAIIALAPLLLSVFGAEYAEQGTLILRLLALSALPHTVVLMALVTARLQHRLGEVIAIQAATSLLVLAAALALAGAYGGLGAAIAWLGAQSIVALVLLATSVRWLLRPNGVFERR